MTLPRHSAPRVLLGATGALGAAGIALTTWLGLWVTPPAVGMGDLVRLVYIHPPIAWVCYLAFGVTALASGAYLWPRTRSLGWDRLAGASGEIGVVFATLTLVTGSIWGYPTWGTWWTWDARLTTTALLEVLYIGYLALRRTGGDREVVAKRSALAGVLAFADVPVNYLSVYWWKTLHQTGTVLNPSHQTKIHGIMAWTLLLGFVSFTLVYAWLVAKRYKLSRLADRWEEEMLDIAMAERAAEIEVGTPTSPPGPSEGIESAALIGGDGMEAAT